MLKTVLLFIFITNTYSCSKKKFQNGFVCVCNSTVCDETPNVNDIKNGTLNIYYTSLTNPGFNTGNIKFSADKDRTAYHILVTNASFQTVYGFGGSFTDSTGINIAKLPQKVQQFLLESYFGENGLGYNLCRVPIGGTDFSIRPYSYDDHDGDRNLKYFQLQEEDVKYKVSCVVIYHFHTLYINYFITENIC